MDKRKVIAEKKKDLSNKKAGNEEVFASCSFSSLGLHSTLCEQLRERMGYEAPTQVQAQAIPVILSGRHVLVSAPTGTGKTVTYLAPIIHHLQAYDPKIQRSDGTFGIRDTAEVVAPFSLDRTRLHYGWGKQVKRESQAAKRLTVSSVGVGLTNFSVGCVFPVDGLQFGRYICFIVWWNHSLNINHVRVVGIAILVATPGRLLDHLKHTSSFLHTNLRWIIFDEADRILELGYGKEIEEILDSLGSTKNSSGSKESATSRISEDFQRQNLLLSATLNEKVNHLAKMSLENPVMIGLDDKKMQPDSSTEQVRSLDSDADHKLEHSGKALVSSNDEYKLPTQLVQRYIKVPCGIRLVVLLSVLKNLFAGESSQKIVVFFSTCDAVDFHYSLLRQFQWGPNSPLGAEPKPLFVGCNTLRLHGNMKHDERMTTFNAFKNEKSALLLSTDVSARGLDFPKVRCIIQYDSPGEATEYVHRVGRTARLGEKGDSLLFLQPVEIDYLQDLNNHGVSLTEYPLLKLLDSFPLYGIKPQAKKFVTLEMHPWVLSLQKSLESFVLAEPTMKKLGQQAFCSWVRAYSAHRGDLKSIFMVKKLHLGHVARSFALKDQPSFVVKSVQKQTDKRKRDQKQKQKGVSKKRRITKKV